MIVRYEIEGAIVRLQCIQGFTRERERECVCARGRLCRTREAVLNNLIFLLFSFHCLLLMSSPFSFFACHVLPDRPWCFFRCRAWGCTERRGSTYLRVSLFGSPARLLCIPGFGLAKQIGALLYRGIHTHITNRCKYRKRSTS